jgi:sigma-B regulation protein RsbU (phosphoserine phosphatase)
VTGLASLLAAFKSAGGCEATVWCKSAEGLARVGGNGAAAPIDRLPSPSDGAVAVELAEGHGLIAAIPGARNAWLSVGPAADAGTLAAQMRLLLPVVSQQMQSTLEVEHAAGELAERYEEINLLYTISEILGRTVDLGDATTRILAEVSDTVGARKGSVLVHDANANTLVAVAALGTTVSAVDRIAVDDPHCVSAKVFRAGHATIVGDTEMLADVERPFRRGAMLSVPILWTTPGAGPQPLGVVNLSDRRTGQAFTAGDQKLISAIATQIGTAIQNSRLVTESLRQQRLVQEMQLAHDLQMRLLPDVTTVAPNATVGARVVPADSVGGDLYHLFRLGPAKTGVMVGDVSGHGYQAALVMALTMSASAIHAQTSADPGETLGSLLHSLEDELADAEMFVSMFYGVVDRSAGQLRYANAGHPHAFIISRDGATERLAAMDPPLGMVPGAPRAAVHPWTSDDLLVLFTDGVSDSRDSAGSRLGEERVLELAVRLRQEPPDVIVDRLFDLVNAHAAGAALRDDLTIVVLRS